MPLKLLKTLSKINACKGAFGSPFGAGIRSTMAAKTSSIPMPVFPLAKTISSALQPINSIISSVTSGIIAPSISTLLITGIISRLFSIARYKLLMVCACIPCVASTNNNTPSQAANARLTS